MHHTFTKEERLCSKRLIDGLFHNGSSFVMYPYRIVFLKPDGQQREQLPVQCIMSVSKRRFKKAVDRNYVKRRMRESFRLQKAELYEFLQLHSLTLLVAFQYVGKEKVPYDQMYKRIGAVLVKLKDECCRLYLGEND
ncbi:ribonuclease P protein component [Sphingobacterium sp. LRF_L2]|uniref:ribonuclease P protein component n=1 Tax=Sphingobacterium sp. LRF_L2 TaxID=3369421 RepID=UPI003F646677